MATIYDVAKAAGVTAATVSVALSGKGVVNSETRARILKCAEELGYRPNLVARSLTTRQTHTLGLVINNIGNPFYAEVALAVERRARESGYRVLFANTDGDDELGRELLEDLAARRVDGVIALPGGLPSEALRSLAATGMPIVACMWEEQDATLSPAVDVDFVAGGRLVAEHLLLLGHTRIAVIADGRPDGVVSHHLRVAGLREVLAAAGHTLDETLLCFGDSSLESGGVAAAALLARATMPSAIFATNDLMAVGVLAAARAAGVRVPHDLSVVGFDDIFLAAHTDPPLTTVRIDKSALMARATDLLLRAIGGEEVSSLPPLMPALVQRDSTAAPASVVQIPEKGVSTAALAGVQRE
jgi:DNA-binding LacI/PurR family transcriptional regulator